MTNDINCPYGRPVNSIHTDYSIHTDTLGAYIIDIEALQGKWDHSIMWAVCSAHADRYLDSDGYCTVRAEVRREKAKAAPDHVPVPEAQLL